MLLQVEKFVQCISGKESLFGLQPETVDSLVLSLLPPSSLHASGAKTIPVLTTGEDDGRDLKIYLTKAALNALRSIGFCIPLVRIKHILTPIIFFYILKFSCTGQ